MSSLEEDVRKGVEGIFGREDDPRSFTAAVSTAADSFNSMISDVYNKATGAQTTGQDFSDILTYTIGGDVPEGSNIDTKELEGTAAEDVRDFATEGEEVLENVHETLTDMDWGEIGQDLGQLFGTSLLQQGYSAMSDMAGTVQSMGQSAGAIARDILK